MKFEWDENKNSINKKKHKVSFDEARTVFYDENAYLKYDEEHSVYEERFKIVGKSYKERLLLVCHCIREDDTIRIMSSRPAEDSEILLYYKKLGGRK